MGLTKCSLKGLIEYSDLRNSDGLYTENDVIGVSTNKCMIPTKADLNGVNLLNYKLFLPGSFAFVADTSRRGDKIALAYNNTDQTFIVSTWYVVFKVCDNARNVISSDYLFLYFNRREFDRYARANSWGSAREYFWFSDMEDIVIELPPLSVQQKYVDVYKAMLANQQSYERGLEDLKLVCDGYFDDAKKKKTLPLGLLIENVDLRNSNSLYSQKDVKGITNNKEFAETKADITSTDLTKFKIVQPGEFAYNSRTDGRDMLVLALNREKQPVIVTFNYNVFRIRKENVIIAEYLYAFFNRAEFDRKVRFASWGSSQELLSWDNLCDIQVPVPDVQEQYYIAEIIKAYTQRKRINEQLKAQIKDICPILIRGSLEDGG